MSRLIDLTGQIFGDLEVLERAENSADGKAQWLCKCKCGNTRMVVGKYLRNGQTKSCVDCSYKARGKNNSVDLTGQQFGYLTCLEPTDQRSGTSIIWKCQCKCGNICYKDSHSLRDGKTKSCGCYRVEMGQQKGYDLLGMRFGKLTVVEKTDQRERSKIVWKCACDCGRTHFVNTEMLMNGKVQSCGCLKSLGNKVIEETLNDLKIPYEAEKRFPDCRDIRPLPFDFYLPTLKTCIEFDGMQHYKPVANWGGDAGFEDRQRKDDIKNTYCKNNNLTLIRIPYADKDKINKEYLLSLLNNQKEML